MICCAVPAGYLSVTNVFTLLRLLPASDPDKDTEILVLRHQITVLQRQPGRTRCCDGTGTCWPAAMRPVPPPGRPGRPRTVRSGELLVLGIKAAASGSWAPPRPAASWVAQAARNLAMDLQDAGSRARFVLRMAAEHARAHVSGGRERPHLVGVS
jgi:hypothetical protein